jgi:hypothetical protein
LRSQKIWIASAKSSYGFCGEISHPSWQIFAIDWHNQTGGRDHGA